MPRSIKFKPTTLKKLNMAWYLARKPYTSHSDYDLFYLNVCRGIFELLPQSARKTPSLVFEPDEIELAEFAYVSTAYFEDKVNGFGFWDAAIEAGKKQIGRALPFVPDEGYAEIAAGSDINSIDIHFLLFLTRLTLHNSSGVAHGVLPHGDPFLLEASKAIYTFLDDIEEIERTDFYDSWRDVRTDDYTALKRKVCWFAQYGYLFTNYLFRKIAEDMAELPDADRQNPATRRPAEYQQVDKRSFQTPGSLLALCPADILARVFIMTDRQREQLLQMKNRPVGNFRVTKKADTHYLFTHTITGDVFPVEAGGLTSELPLDKASVYNTTLAPWNDAWHVSGICFGTSEAKAKADDETHQGRYCAYNALYRQQVLETAGLSSGSMQEFFGARLVSFPGAAALEEALNSFQRFYSEKIVREKKIPKNEIPPVAKVQLNGILPLHKPVAMFISQNNNGEFITIHERLERILQTEDPMTLPPKDILFFAEAFTDSSLSSEYWQYLYGQYEPGIFSVLLMAPCKDPRDYEALLRIYRPQDFTESRLPAFTLSGYGKMGDANRSSPNA